VRFFFFGLFNLLSVLACFSFHCCRRQSFMSSCSLCSLPSLGYSLRVRLVASIKYCNSKFLCYLYGYSILYCVFSFTISSPSSFCAIFPGDANALSYDGQSFPLLPYSLSYFQSVGFSTRHAYECVLDALSSVTLLECCYTIDCCIVYTEQNVIDKLRAKEGLHLLAYILRAVRFEISPQAGDSDNGDPNQ